MRRLFHYVLPEGHTSNRKSLLICIVVGVSCILCAALAERLPVDLAPSGQPQNPGLALIQILLRLLALVAFCMCFISAVVALLRRVGSVDSVNGQFERTLVREYLSGLFRRDRGREDK